MSSAGLKYASPRKFTFSQRVQLNVLPPVIAFAFTRLANRCHFDVRNKKVLWDAVFEHGGILCAFWHECLGLAACHHRNTPTVHTLTSFSFDGELAARTVSSFGLKSLRGSSSRGGGRCAQAIGERPESGVPCGVDAGWSQRAAPPGQSRNRLCRGTHRSADPANAYALDKSWRLRSWDRFPIPKPGARIICRFGTPIEAPANTSHEEIEHTRLAVEEALNRMHREIEEELGDPQRI